MALAGCGGSDGSGGASGPKAAAIAAKEASQPRRGGTIEYGHYQEPPCLVTTWVQTGYLTRQYLEQLITVDDKGKFLPWLADAWEISDDKKTYTFQLKRDVTFSNGEPFDSAAVKANFDNWFSTDPTRRNGYVAFHVEDHIDRIETPDDHTVVFRLKHPHHPFLSALSQYAFGFLAPSVIKKGPEEWCVRPVGTGPFVVEKWNRGSNVVLKRNPSYSSPPGDVENKGPAYVEGINWKFLKDNTARWGSLKSAESDVIYDVPGVNWAEANQRYEILQHVTGGRPSQLALAVDHEPFNDVRVRKAFQYASDRRKAVETVFQGAVPYNGNGALSTSSPEHVEELEDYYGHDPDKANQLLDEAGWTERNGDGTRTKRGKPLTVRIVYGAGSIISGDGAQFLQVVQDQANQVGFDVQLKPITTAEFFAGKGRQPGEYEIQPGYWVARSAEIFQVVWKPDAKVPDGTVIPNANNPSRFQEPEVWKLVRQADRTYDDAKRTALYQEVQRALVEKHAVTVGAYPLTVTLALGDNLTGIRLNASIGEPIFNDAYFVK
ncbi:MAG: ABC transporter substrate-binding protein [Solirubrobacteraceae bacterium]|nr:ABC transporter substrate-binding protein [Solirubrobacteraceae bacterium]